MSETIKVDVNNYQRLAVQTKKDMSTIVLPIDEMKNDPLVIASKQHLGKVLDNIHMAMGIIGEVGELQKAINNKDLVNIIEESGDILWFVAVSCNDNGLEFSKIVETALQTLDLEDANNHNDFDAFGFVDFIKKYSIYNDGNVDENQFRAELIIYLTNIVRMVVNQTYWRGTKGYEIETILEININKLFARFGSKFSQYLANNRDLVGERELLESGSDV